jgi:hypothetical protein
MAFAVEAGYGIAICIATFALIGLSSIAPLPMAARASGGRKRQEVVLLRTGLCDRNGNQ